MGYYPPAALQAGVGGVAVIRCRATAEGVLASCRVLDEAPNGYGFGEAALRMSPLFRMKPTARSGKPVEGSLVTIPIGFNTSFNSVDLDLYPWDGAVLVVPIPGKPPRGVPTMACPSAADPERKCQLHRITWASVPDPETSGSVLSRSDLRTGKSIMECTGGADGLLSACRVANASPAAEAAMLTYAKLLRVRPMLKGDIPMSVGRIVVEFNWAAINDDGSDPAPDSGLVTAQQAAAARPTGPDWLRRPPIAALNRLYPHRAANLGKSGAVAITCQVTATGRLTQCEVVQEAPEGWGFGAAAVAMAEYFEMTPRTPDGRSVEGATVTIPMRFTLGNSPPPPLIDLPKDVLVLPESPP